MGGPYDRRPANAGYTHTPSAMAVERGRVGNVAAPESNPALANTTAQRRVSSPNLTEHGGCDGQRLR